MTFEEVISRFEVKSRYKNRVQAVCPAHSDTLSFENNVEQPTIGIPQQSREEIAARHAGYIGASEPEKPEL